MGLRGPAAPCHTRGVPSSAELPLTVEELRAVARYAVSCAEPVQGIFRRACPGDDRPAAALAAARTFADGAPRSRLQREAATAAHRAAREAPTEAARYAASSAAHAGAAAYLHPVPKATQVGHLLGAAAHAARSAELATGGDAVVAEYMLDGAARRMPAEVLDVLRRYPRAPGGTGRVDALMARLDSLLRDPPPAPRPVDDPGPFFHGTRADVRPGDLLTPGWGSNYGSGRRANHIYLTASQHGAPLAAEMARGEGPPRVYRVEPLGPIEDDPNVTDKKFPGNPTRSYRTTEPLRVVEEVVDFAPPSPVVVSHLRARMAELAELGIEAMD